MEHQKLLELLEDMSLSEKAEQLLQVGGFYLEKEGVVTGPENAVGYTREEIDQAGTVLGVIGAARLKAIQKNYMEKQPHRIPLITVTARCFPFLWPRAAALTRSWPKKVRRLRRGSRRQPGCI